MNGTAEFLQSLVPVSQFNRGQAAKIFDRRRTEKEIIVLKNNQPSAVIISPKEYTRLREIEEEYYLLMEANKRLSAEKEGETLSMASVMEHLGITEDELEETEEIVIE